MVERESGALLNRRRRSIPHVRAYGMQRVDQVLAANCKSNSRAGHVEALRERMEFDCEVLGALNLERARRLYVIVRELHVGAVGQENDVVLAAGGDRFLIQR